MLVGGDAGSTAGGFKRVVTSIHDPKFEGICHELGLKDTIIHSRTISRFLEDMVDVGENVELCTSIKDEARFFTLIAKGEDTVAAKDLKLSAVRPRSSAITLMASSRMRMKKQHSL